MKKYHRKYSDRNWDYRAISIIIDGREVIYYTLINNSKKSSGVEIYGGGNYVVDSDSKSYSKSYLAKEVPEKYRNTVLKLISKHSKTKWSTAKYVNLN